MHIGLEAEGLLKAVRREDVVVLVDVLRFCSTAVAAVRAVVRIISAPGCLEAKGLAALRLPVMSSSKEDYEVGKPTDSPLWYQRYAVTGTRVVYPSSNCSRLLSSVRNYPYVVLGHCSTPRRQDMPVPGRVARQGSHVGGCQRAQH